MTNLVNLQNCVSLQVNQTTVHKKHSTREIIPKHYIFLIDLDSLVMVFETIMFDTCYDIYTDLN